MISTDEQSIQCVGIQHSFVILALNCMFNLLRITAAMQPSSVPSSKTRLSQVLFPMLYPNREQWWGENCQFQIQTVGQEVHLLTGDILRFYSFNSMFWLKRVWGFSFLNSNYTWEFRSNSRTHCQTFTEFLPLSFFPILILKSLLLSVDIWWTHSIILYLCWVIIFIWVFTVSCKLILCPSEKSCQN